jgi:hypothetical protein
MTNRKGVKLHLDYSLSTKEERKQYVDNLLENTNPEQLTDKYLQYISDYLLFVADKNQTKKEQAEEYPITTRNREATLNKRQVSFDEMVDLYEYGEDSLHAIITNDKNQIMDPKDPITADDMRTVPGLREIIQTIDALNNRLLSATGKNKYNIKKQIIEMWKQAYILRASAKGGVGKGKISPTHKDYTTLKIEENIYFDSEGYPVSDSPISFLSADKVSYLLTNYADLKKETGEEVNCDMYSVLLDFEGLVERTLLPKYPMFFDVMVRKINKYSNAEIKQYLENTYGTIHTEQYISTLWKQRIPKMIAEKAQEEYLLWYYTNIEKGNWKTCRKCGETKLAHPIFFSRNTSSKDHFYSVCKECRKKANNA